MSQGDWEAVAGLLGRAPQGNFEVVVRDAAGRPVVIANSPFLADGTPMPTRYWLVGQAERDLVSRLESTGGVRAAEGAVEPAELRSGPRPLRGPSRRGRATGAPGAKAGGRCRRNPPGREMPSRPSCLVPRGRPRPGRPVDLREARHRSFSIHPHARRGQHGRGWGRISRRHRLRHELHPPSRGRCRWRPARAADADHPPRTGCGPRRPPRRAGDEADDRRPRGVPPRHEPPRSDSGAGDRDGGCP